MDSVRAEPGPDPASRARVLVVDDDETVTDVLTRYLQREGMSVAVAGDGAAALALAQRSWPDLVVLDLMLPGVDGLEVCRRLREIGPVPVIMLTALGEESDRVLGLEIGADDYVTKPFSPRELLLRAQLVLRRSAGSQVARPAVLRDGDLRVDVGARTAVRAGVALALTVREFDLLAFLLAHPRQAFSRAQLLERVWGWSFGDQSTVTVHVRRLREKLEPDPSQPQRLVTVWGVGYRYDPIDSDRADGAPAGDSADDSADGDSADGQPASGQRDGARAGRDAADGDAAR